MSLVASSNFKALLKTHLSYRAKLRHETPHRLASADFIRDLPKQYRPNKASRTGKPTMAEFSIILPNINIYFLISAICASSTSPHFYSLLHCDCIHNERAEAISLPTHESIMQTNTKTKSSSIASKAKVSDDCVWGRGWCFGELFEKS